MHISSHLRILHNSTRNRKSPYQLVSICKIILGTKEQTSRQKNAISAPRKNKSTEMSMSFHPNEHIKTPFQCDENAVLTTQNQHLCNILKISALQRPPVKYRQHHRTRTLSRYASRGLSTLFTKRIYSSSLNVVKNLITGFRKREKLRI